MKNEFYSKSHISTFKFEIGSYLRYIKKLESSLYFHDLQRIFIIYSFGSIKLITKRQLIRIEEKICS